MAIEKYIIDKSELTALLRGEDLKIQPKGNIKGFCVEIAGNATNGDMIKALFPSASVTDHFILGSPIGNIIYIRLEKHQEMRVQEDWWNAPYKVESGE